MFSNFWLLSDCAKDPKDFEGCTTLLQPNIRHICLHMMHNNGACLRVKISLGFRKPPLAQKAFFLPEFCIKISGCRKKEVSSEHATLSFSTRIFGPHATNNIFLIRRTITVDRSGIQDVQPGTNSGLRSRPRPRSRAWLPQLRFTRKRDFCTASTTSRFRLRQPTASIQQHQR